MARVMHFEVHASDPDRLIAFYTDLFGWSFAKWDGPMDYWLITTGPNDQPGINGGLVRRHGPAPTGMQPSTAFICTINVDSAESTLARGVELGGLIALPLMAVPGIGWLGYLKDVDGNTFGVMQTDPNAA